MEHDRLELLCAKGCYGHLGGTLGDRLFARLVELGWFRRTADRATVYELTAWGVRELKKLGVDPYAKGRPARAARPSINLSKGEPRK